jgi:hypothetical protein
MICMYVYVSAVARTARGTGWPLGPGKRAARDVRPKEVNRCDPEKASARPCRQTADRSALTEYQRAAASREKGKPRFPCKAELLGV